MRGPALPPPAENIAPEPIQAVCSFARRRDDASDGLFDGRVARRITGERRCLSPCHSLHADGRIGPLGRTLYTWCRRGSLLWHSELRAVATCLDRHGFVGRPGWVDLQMGVRPPPVDESEPGEWAHGWQHCASSASEYHYRKSVVMCQSCPANQAHLRSHSGPGSSQVLHGCPTKPEFRIAPDLFRTLILERFRSKVQVRIDPG